ncbi:MAG: GNAT family N-acetyltransferase [Flavobacteriaceae bacterium]|jgi:GNAT superfamily N-acetyltransferase|nr:GNAT family N-acetyltransferase [Flavobacteriaceae bacterium]
MIPVYETTDGAYLITTDTSKMDVDTIHQYLSEESYWAKNIPLNVVKRFMQHSFCFAVIFNEKQIGFARLITDYTTFAYLADVFILPEFRGKGLSKKLLKFIHANPELQGLRRWILATRDAHELYEQFGWIKFTDEQTQRFMQKHNPDVYEIA